MTLKLPPTRNHRQLANWINTNKLVDDQGRRVEARVTNWRTNTDRKIGRLRWPGKGREGLLLEIWPVGSFWHPDQRLFRHESSETYRRHSEARQWVEENLRRKR
jgi:hypothetical protein